MLLNLAFLIACRNEPAETVETPDADGDGFAETVDCDDQDPAVFPGADELCDGVDQDCDAAVDETPADGNTLYADADGDGFGGTAYTLVTCESEVSGYVGNTDDCDDLDASSNPDGVEVCDGADNNCDGQVDEGLDAQTVYADADGDGYGDPDASEVSCGGLEGYVANLDDCDDGSADISPAAEEVCGDGVDNDCDGTGAGCGLEGAYDAGDATAIFLGESPGDLFGAPTKSVGDLSANGLPELAIGARGSDRSGTDAGAIYLYSLPVVQGTYTADDAYAVIEGEADGDQLFAVTGAGDGNGDGVGDLFVSARRNDDGGTDSGKVYFLQGPFNGTVGLGDAAASWTGVADGDQAGLTVVGDQNGDGEDDLMVGVQRNDNGGNQAGAVFIVNGPFGAWLGDQSLYANDALLRGPAGGQAGGGLAYVGDVDGDGVGDIVVGTPTLDHGGQVDAGGVYLVLGPVSGNGDLADVADARLVGQDGDEAGWGIARTGDLDGDGLDDYMVNAQRSDTGADNGNEGSIHVVVDAWTEVDGDVALSDSWMTITGANTEDKLATVGGTSDLDGDGNLDLLVGTRWHDAGGEDAGAIWFIYGPHTAGTMDVADAGGRIDGDQAGDGLGSPAGFAGDPNGDGYSEVVMGARWSDANGDNAGAAYLFKGTGL